MDENNKIGKKPWHENSLDWNWNETYYISRES